MDALTPAPEGKRRPSEWGKRRFRPGLVVTDIHDLIHALSVGCWIYWAGTVKHPTILRNMSLATLQGGVRSGIVRIAVENSK